MFALGKDGKVGLLRVLAAAAMWFLVVPVVALAETGALAPVTIALGCPPDPERCGGYLWEHTFGQHLTRNGFHVTELPREAVGDADQTLNDVIAGKLTVIPAPIRSAARFSPLVYGLAAPFLFDSFGHLYRVMHRSRLLEYINAAANPKGVRVLAFFPAGGFTGIFNTQQPITTLENMKGLHMRALDETQMGVFEAWGVSAEIVGWLKVPDAFRRGVIDGYLQAPVVPLNFGHTEYVRFFTDARITPSLRLILASQTWYDGLAAERRAVVDHAVEEANAVVQKWANSRVEGVLRQLKDTGVTVSQLTPAARRELVKRAKPVLRRVLDAKMLAIFTAEADAHR